MPHVHNEFGYLADELVLEVMRRMPSLYDRWNMMHCCARFATIQTASGASGLLGDLTTAQREQNAFTATMHGHDLLLNALLMAGVSSRTMYRNTVTLLMVAAKEGHLLCVRALLTAGSDVEASCCRGDLFYRRGEIGFPFGRHQQCKRDTALMIASKCGHVLCVGALLVAGSSPNTASPDGSTALMSAARFGQYLCTCALLEARSDPHMVDDDGKTALMHAALHGHVSCLNALLEAGSDPNFLEDYDDDTPLMLAAAIGNDQCVNALLAARADPNKVNHNSDTALLLAADEMAGSVRSRALPVRPDKDPGMRYHECLIALINAGADLNKQDGLGNTALHKALKGGCDLCVTALIDAGSDLEIRNEHGETA